MKINISNKYNNFQGINESSKFISRFADLGESKLSSHLGKDFSLLGKLSESNISGNPAFFDSFAHHASESIDAVENTSLLSNIGEQAMDTLPLLSLYFKYKAPLRDFQNGDLHAGIVKSGVRISESFFLLPFKIAWAICGAALGGVKSICGIKSETSGFGKGYLSANNAWNRVRNGLENFITSPYTFCENLIRNRKQELIEDYESREKKRIDEIDNDLEFLKTINQHKLNIKHQKVIDDLTSAELHIDQILNMIPPSKPIAIPQLEKWHTEVNHSNISDFVNECHQQQAEYEDFYNTSIAEIENILKSKTTNQSEKEIMEKILNKIRHYYNTTLKVNKDNLASLSRIIAIHEYLYRKANLEGFNKIAGYTDLKEQLNQLLLKPIKMCHAGKDADLPNMILFHGPQGCGKTMFSNALAEEALCNFIDVNLSSNEQKNFKKIEDSVQKAKELFEKDGLYTIIKIDEFDVFLVDNPILIKRFNKMINSVAKNNHCTIVATTNFLEDINPQLIPQNNFTNFYIAPAQKENLKAILEFYLKDNNLLQTDNINYTELVDSIYKAPQNKGFSNARIVKILQKSLLNSEREITTEILKDNFCQECPDVSIQQ